MLSATTVVAVIVMNLTFFVCLEACKFECACVRVLCLYVHGMATCLTACIVANTSNAPLCLLAFCSLQGKNVLGIGGPRKMAVIIPHLNQNNERVPVIPKNVSELFSFNYLLAFPRVFLVRCLQLYHVLRMPSRFLWTSC